MGPRRAPSHAESEERRTKQRADRPAASASRARAAEAEAEAEAEHVDLPYGYLFDNDAAVHARFLADLSRRAIIEPKSLDSAFFLAEGFDVVQLLEASHLRVLAEMSIPYSQVMVRAFYHNLSYREGDLRSRVCGVDIVMTTQAWRDVLGHDFDAQPGLEYDGDSTAPIPGFVREEIVHETRRRDIARGHSTVYTVGLLSVDARVLHYILTHILFPRAFNHSRVLEADWVIIWAIRHRQNVNWRHFICWMMAKAKYRGALPYACLVMKILRHFNVPMPNERLIQNREYNARFGLRLLERTGIQKRRGRWVWSTQPQVEVPEPEGEPEPDADAQMADAVADEPVTDDEPDAQHQMTEPEGGWTLSHVMTGINSLAARVGHIERRQKSSTRKGNQRFRNLFSRMTRIEEKMAHFQVNEGEPSNVAAENVSDEEESEESTEEEDTD